MNRALTPTSIAPPVANYAHAVLSHSPSRWLHTAGVVPVEPDGTVPGDSGAQARVVWANIKAILDEAEMSASDLVSVTTYVVPGEGLGPIMEARDEFLDGTLAASTLLTVPALAQPAWKVEIAVIAAS